MQENRDWVEVEEIFITLIFPNENGAGSRFGRVPTGEKVTRYYVDGQCCRTKESAAACLEKAGFSTDEALQYLDDLETRGFERVLTYEESMTNPAFDKLRRETAGAR